MKKQFRTIMSASAAMIMTAVSCVDTSQLENDLSDLENRVDAIEEQVAQANSNAVALQKIFDGAIKILDAAEREDGTGYDITFSDGTVISVYAESDGEGVTPVIGIDSEGNWTVKIGDGDPEVIEGSANAFGDDAPAPQLRVNADGYWEISTDGGKTFALLEGADGKPIKATVSDKTDSFFKEISYDSSRGELHIVLADGRELDIPVLDILSMELEGYQEGEETICLNETLRYPAVFSEDVAEAFCTCPDGWRVQILETAGGTGQEVAVTGPASGQEGEYQVKIYLQSEQEYLKVYTFTFHLNPVSLDQSDCTEWNEFLSDSPDNILLDFSYAGYMHGETAPAEIAMDFSSGTANVNGETFRIYDVTDYGAIPDDGKSDREAFLALLESIAGEPVLNAAGDQLTFPHKNSYKVVIYFPEGDFILHTEEDNLASSSAPEGYTTPSIIIRGSDIVLKGAGRDKTTITMQSPGMPSTSARYSSPDMIQLKHNTGIQYSNILATVTGDSPKGSFEVTVSGAGSLKEGDWVCLYLAPNNDPEVVAQELSPYQPDGSWEIVRNGVTVEDIHQIESVSGNTVRFREPLMHEVTDSWNWSIVGYQHYENVGVEDITFVGNAKDRFDHHAGWEDDGAYKLISMTRLVNSWMRRVGFHSVSEASSLISCANSSVYDVIIDGSRGHAAIRSQASSRIFIGAVEDKAEGYSMDELGHDVTGSSITTTGQYHATGVSKESIGAVLWRNTWGNDACFEAHATQPRATLIDCCSGGWMRWRQGGDAAQMPNHLADLTVWNFNNTTPYSGEWIWWDNGSAWWKFLPPAIIGFHGEPVSFNQEQSLRISSNGSQVSPESLYEAQLRRRLGYVPAWLNALK